MRLKPEDTQMRVRVKNTRLFDKENLPVSTEPPSSSEKKVQIFTNTKPSIPQKVMMIDASTEVSQNDHVKQTTTTGRPLQVIQMKPKPDSIFKQKIPVPPVDADANQPLYGYRQKLLSIRRRGDFDKSAELIPTVKAGGHVRDAESQPPQKQNEPFDDQLERYSIEC
jgi:hypothetical protein